MFIEKDVNIYHKKDEEMKIDVHIMSVMVV